MRNYIILNGVNSNTITGLLISTLPPITKPKIRTQVEEIDGRDGDIVTKLGYSAYEKEFQIGLYGDFDIDEVIAYFNSEGTVVFSNEDDKYYNYQIVDQIDFEKLIKFKTASVKMHVQPFKYPLEETPVEITIQNVTASGETMSLNNTADAPIEIDLKGNTSQDGTPTPEAPVEVETTTGGQEVDIVGKNLFNTLIDKSAGYTSEVNGITQLYNDNGSITLSGTATAQTDLYITNAAYGSTTNNFILDNNTAYTLSLVGNTNNNIQIIIGYGNNAYNTSTTKTITPNSNISWAFIRIANGTNLTTPITIYPQLEKGSTASEYQAYQSQSYELNLGKNLCPIKTFESLSNVRLVSTATSGGATVHGIPAKAGQIYTATFEVTTLPSSDYRMQFINSSDATQTQGETDPTNIIEREVVNCTSLQKYSISITPTQNGYLYLRCVPVGFILDNIQIEKGTATDYTPYKEPIELCKIGDYQDKIYKEAGKWYIEKQIGKIVLNGSEEWYANGENTNYGQYGTNTSTPDKAYGTTNIISDRFITALSNVDNAIAGRNTLSYIFITIEKSIVPYGANNFKTWLSSNNTTVYYVLADPTTTEITDSELITQLEAINIARSYDLVTNISQNTANKPFILDAIAVQKGSDTGVVNNTGNIYSKPTLDIEGTGIAEIYLDGNQMFNVDLSTINECIIDTTNLEAYDPATSQLMNRQVTGDYSNFKLNTGNNTIKVSGNVSKVTISDYTRWL